MTDPAAMVSIAINVSTNPYMYGIHDKKQTNMVRI